MITLTEIETEVIAILARQLLLTPADIAADARIDDLGLDSLGKVEAIFAMEERFGIAIPFNANDSGPQGFDLTTVPDIVAGVARLVAGQAVG